MTKSAKLTRSDLNQFTGSETWYRHGINRNVLFTDGAKYVADHAGAYWLLDEIAIIQPHDKRIAVEEVSGLETRCPIRQHRYADLRGRQRQHRLLQKDRVHGFPA